MPAVCPRCRGPIRAPDLMSPDWRCDRDGSVHPLHLPPPSPRTLAHLVAVSGIPVWVPLPPPTSWLVTGLAKTCDHERVTATAVALSGPSPVGGAADLLIIAEEPGVGLGAGYAGLPGTDAGVLPGGRSDAVVHIGSHPTRLWQVPGVGPGRTALVGEAEGLWLWLILWPQDADVVLLERLTLCDARSHPLPPLEFGAPTPRLSGAEPAGLRSL